MWLMLLFLAYGCASISHVTALRNAQDEFNAAAALENQSKLDPLSADATILLNGQSNASYRLVLNEVTKLIETQGQALQADNLLGTAYSLKALSEWRLREYEAAMRTTNEVEHANVELLPRDKAIIAALGGLIKNDQAFAHMTLKDKSYKELKTLLSESVADINQGQSQAPEGNGIHTYLSMAKLASLKNWLDLFNKPNDFATEVPTGLNKLNEQSEWCRSAQPAWESFVRQMDGLGTKESEATLAWWKKRLALPAACQ